VTLRDVGLTEEQLKYLVERGDYREGRRDWHEVFRHETDDGTEGFWTDREVTAELARLALACNEYHG
jgi:hypothetical protein